MADLGPGDHVCGLYPNELAQQHSIAAYLGIGLKAKEKVLYIADPTSAAKVLAGVHHQGVDPHAAIAAGQLEVRDPIEVYLPKGRFDIDATLASLDAAKAQAKEEGYPALRATGDMAWAASGAPGTEDLAEYEARLNDHVRSSRMHGICQYNLEHFPAATMLQVLATHPVALLDDRVVENFYFTPPQDFLSPRREAVMLERWMRNLTDRDRLETLRERAAQARLDLERQKAIIEYQAHFLNMASHEMRTPLTPLTVRLGLLADEEGLTPVQRDHIDVLQRNAVRLTNLVRDVLDASRLQSGCFPLETRDTELAAIADAVVEDYQPEARRRGITLQADTHPAPAHADPERVHQMLGNLVENALRLVPKGGHIAVHTRSDAGKAHLSVSDDGPGFDATQARHLFQPFTRLHDHIEGVQRGSGMGLFIVQTLAQQHGGDAQGHSPGPGKGATFEVTLPGPKATGPLPPGTTATHPPGRPLQRPRRPMAQGVRP